MKKIGILVTVIFLACQVGPELEAADYLCVSADDCQSGFQCLSGLCTSSDGGSSSLAIGSACGNASECASGFCADGICCQTSCDSACDSCNRTGALGACGPTPAQTAASPTCGGYLCNGTLTTCPSSCTVPTDCTTGYTCDDSICSQLLKTLAFSDDFNDNSVTADWNIFSATGGSITAQVTGQHLEVSYLAGNVEGAAGIVTRRRYDGTSSQSTVQIPSIPGSGTAEINLGWQGIRADGLNFKDRLSISYTAQQKLSGDLRTDDACLASGKLPRCHDERRGRGQVPQIAPSRPQRVHGVLH